MTEQPTPRDLIAKTLKLKSTKSVITRRRRDGDRKQGIGDDNHLVGGSAGSGDTEYRYRSLVQFDFSPSLFDDVRKVVKAEMVVQEEADSAKHYAWGAKPRVEIRRLTSSFSESTRNGEGNWGSDDYEWPSEASTAITIQDVVKQDDLLIYFDITKEIGQYLPKDVLDPSGANGKGATNYGYVIRADDEWDNAQRWVFFSQNHDTESRRPYILITYEPINHAPVAPTTDAAHPAATTTFADYFAGTHSDPDGDDMSKRIITVYPKGGTTPVWTLPSALQIAGSDEVATGRFSVPLTLALGSLKSQTDYEWTAKTMDPSGSWGPESARRGFKITSRPPTVTAKSLGSVSTLSGLKFGGAYSDPEGHGMASYQIQLRPTLAPGDPSWEDGDDLWDTGEAKPTADQVTRRVIEDTYSGSRLTARGYSYRVRAKDTTGVWSAWSYATVTLTREYAPAWNVLDLTTGIDRDAPVRVALYDISRNEWRVVTVATGGTWTLTGNGKTTTALAHSITAAALTTALKVLWKDAKITVTLTTATNTRTYDIHIEQNADVGAVSVNGAALTGTGHAATVTPRFTRGPGKLIGYVEDPINLGASKFLNSGGEVYFTLPALHPYCEVIEPYSVHYSVEQWYGDRFRPIFDGLITDFDATPDEVVFYGVDYLGLYLSCVDERFLANKGPDFPSDMQGGGGSKYVDKTIDAVIRDQLTYHRNQTSSLVNFISIGSISAMVERVTIYSTYTEALPFIAGLLDSHKQGTGKEARIEVRRKATGGFEVVVLDNIGTDRPNIRLEYGGLLTDFRVVALGDFGTRILGTGLKRGEVKPLRAVGTSSPALDETRWGRITKTRFYPELIDENDLRRRVREDAAQIGKVGKRMALAIRADSLVPFDGWDIGDNIRVDIERGVVDSDRYGSAGYWEALGVEFRYYSDGHHDLAFTVTPKKTATAASPDLIPSRNPGLSKEWQIGLGTPTVYGFPPTPVVPATPRVPVANPWSDAFSVDFGQNDGSFPEFDAEPVVATHYLDLATGCIYEIQPDMTYLNVFCPADVIPPGAGQDTESPPAPEVLAIGTTLFKQENGTYVIALLATVGYPDTNLPIGMDDLDYYLTETTSSARDDDPAQPDWTVALERNGFSEDATGHAPVEVIITPVQAATRYWVRVTAVDTSGNYSQPSPAVEIVSAADMEAPPRVTGIVLQEGMNAFAVRWDAVEVADLKRYEVRWRPLSGGDWTVSYIRGTLMVVTNLINDTEYDVQVRSVDTSDNTLDDDGRSVKASLNADSGWVDGGTVTPSAIPGDSLVWDEAMIENLFGGKIKADWITGGTLTVGGALDANGNPTAVAITVVDGNGDVIGEWGLLDKSNPQNPVYGLRVLDPRDNGYELVLNNSSLTVWSRHDPAHPFKIVEIGPRGINAASVTFGSQRGGHNLVRNSSFELGAFAVSVADSVQWDVAADWTGTVQGTPTNTITGTGGLTMSPT